MQDTVTRPPLISIITPTLNQAAFIGDTLRSVAKQTYMHIEHIVVDGGSTDGTLDILREWDGRWISEADRGQADAINKGLNMSKGEIVGWLNSDDVYLGPQVLRRVAEAFTDGVEAVSGLGSYIDAAGRHLYDYPADQLALLAHDSLRYRCTILQPATFLRRERFMPLDASLHYAFDWDLFIRLSAEVTITPIPLAIAGYRLHGGGKTETGGAKRKRELLTISRRHRGVLNPASVTLTAMMPAYYLADRIPSARLYNCLERLCRLSQRLSGNRGIPD